MPPRIAPPNPPPPPAPGGPAWLFGTTPLAAIATAPSSGDPSTTPSTLAEPGRPFPVRDRRAPTRRRAALAAVIAVPLLVGIVIVARVDRGAGELEAGTASPGSTSSKVGDVVESTSEALDWPAEIADLAAFVEAERGLRFTEVVPVERWTPEEVEAETAGVFDLPEDDLTRAYRALGLLGVEPDERRSSSPGAWAYYDGTEGVIVAPDVGFDDVMRSVIVHELVHALQDQHGLLGTEVFSVEHARSQLALVEGDATMVEYDWWYANTPASSEPSVYEDWPGGWAEVEAVAPHLVGEAGCATSRRSAVTSTSTSCCSTSPTTA